VRRERMLVEARQEALTLALRIAALVVKRAVMVDPGGVAVAQAAEALRLLVRPTRAILAVHPDDRAVVADALPAMCARMAAAEHVELALDDTLERGSCVLRTAGGAEIEATVEGQLRRIAEALLPGQGGGTSSVPEVGP
jgi:flagellar biosynthesis/type III secretory pathway protein FliH